MAKSERLRWRDVRAAYLLVGEVAELGADPHDWWGHLLERLCQLTGASGAIGGELEGLFHKTPTVNVVGNFFARYRPDDLKLFRDFIVQEKWRAIDEAGKKYFLLFQGGAPLLVRSHEQLIDSRAYRQSEFFNDYFRPSRFDDRLCCFCRSPIDYTPTAELWFGTTLHRELGDPQFSHRDRRLVYLIHSELISLFGVRLARCRGFATRPLSPRLRQTRDLLLAGHSEKQIANECGLSKATVNEYVATLYKRYEANSRAELMALFLQWRGDRRELGAERQLPEANGPNV